MESKEKITYFLYARKSSEGEERQVQSIDDQIKRAKKLAEDYGLIVKEILTESHSAKIPGTRPVFNSMLERIEKGEANGILCWQINRLSRNPVDSGRVQWMLQQGIIKSIQTTDGERKPDDNAVLFSVEAGVSNQYIIDLRKNIKRGLESKLEKGVLPCLAPLGYVNEPYERTIVKDETNFPLVRKAWDIMLTGNYSPRKVLEIATNEWGLRTRKTRKLGCKPLSLSGMYKIFNNPFYAGIIRYGGREYAGSHAPMITLEEFDRVQVILGKKGKPRSKTYEFSFTGFMQCEECGGFITAETKTKFVKKTGKLEEYTYYRCTRRKKYMTCSQRGSVNLEDLEEQIEKELEKYTILPEFRQWALEILNEWNDKEVKDRTTTYKTQQQIMNDTQKQLDTLTGMRYRGLIDDEEYMREKPNLQKQIARLKQQLRQTESRAEQCLELTEQTFNFATYARHAFVNGSIQDKKEILSALCSNPLLNNRKLFITAEKWFVRVREGYIPLKAEYDRLELGKEGLTKAQKDACASLRTQWWRWGESNPRANETFV
ncbi:MAG: resolvase domain-containing protein [Parcubacteria group bacterium Greene1014_15]|nr:MAG: resolvase domain-containing protein [Parcubacteria group bacterium Greene1014_15]